MIYINLNQINYHVKNKDHKILIIDYIKVVKVRIIINIKININQKININRRIKIMIKIEEKIVKHR